MILANPFDVFWYLLRYWWVWLGPVSFSLFISAWLHYRQTLYKKGIGWTILEIKMPREIDKSPKAMDQFFSAIYGLRNAASNLVEKYWDGEVPLWFSMELVSFGGEIHFYIRTPSKHKNVVMSHLYANYPSLDIDETPDYIERFPAHIQELHADGMELWGTELLLVKADAYPVRTYLQFEDILDRFTINFTYESNAIYRFTLSCISLRRVFSSGVLSIRIQR
ncbi:MAG: hypothetical protein HYT34_02520, partial [Candidatus Ryanbacteria bacterium]|nr:hypothetical protein [Candidatus Ryanbacteria bacterium]